MENEKRISIKDRVDALISRAKEFENSINRQIRAFEKENKVQCLMRIRDYRDIDIGLAINVDGFNEDGGISPAKSEK